MAEDDPLDVPEEVAAVVAEELLVLGQFLGRSRAVLPDRMVIAVHVAAGNEHTHGEQDNVALRDQPLQPADHVHERPPQPAAAGQRRDRCGERGHQVRHQVPLLPQRDRDARRFARPPPPLT